VRATSTPPQTTAAPGVKAPPPLADAFVTISRQEHIALKSAAHYWQTLHRKAVARFQWRELRYQRILRELKTAGIKSNAALQAELDLARGQVRDLQKRVFASKSERHKHCENQTGAATCRRPRGQQHGSTGHGRTVQTQLPARHEDATLDKPQCPKCGLAFNSFAGTEDAQVLEIEVKAYRRVIHRHRYTPCCQCGCASGIVSAAAPARLIIGPFFAAVAGCGLDRFPRFTAQITRNLHRTFDQVRVDELGRGLKVDFSGTTTYPHFKKNYTYKQHEKVNPQKIFTKKETICQFHEKLLSFA